MTFDFIKAFNEKVEELDINWSVKGLINEHNQVFSLGSDSKLIGRIFELIAAPIVKIVAEENGYEFIVSQSQTVYPDFTLKRPGESDEMIAVDIKTTYRRNSRAKFGYTLGSYASFLRNGTKNIAYHYESYSEHIVIGFIYDRNPNADEIVVDINELKIIEPPYNNVEFFVQEKYKIAGEKPGSGNTENIGSFMTNNISDFKNGAGPFTELGKEVFDHYWEHYPKYRAETAHFKNLDEYFQWLQSSGHPYSALKGSYDDWKSRKSSSVVSKDSNMMRSLDAFTD